jgi:predicted TIM-barrel fold metal-dependent hydrolase
MNFQIVSTDSHIIEPPDVWTQRLDAIYRDRAPRIVTSEGAEWWIVDGVRLGFVHGPRRDELKSTPVSGNMTFRDIRPSAYTAGEYVKENLQDGVVGSVVCPTYGLLMYALRDHALLSAICRAYNDWMSEFASADRQRLKGVAMINNFVVADAIAELERAKELGLVAATISVWPGTKHAYNDPAYEELWTAAERLRMPLYMHVHSNHNGPYGGISTPSRYVNIDLWVRMSLADMIFSGVFERHPHLKIISAENEGGWIPFFLSQMDLVYRERIHSGEQQSPPGAMRKLPSVYFRENILVSIIRDRTLVEARHTLGVNHILWGSDYPHDQSTYPHTQSSVRSLLSGVPAHEANRILLRNAAELFGFTVPG